MQLAADGVPSVKKGHMCSSSQTQSPIAKLSWGHACLTSVLIFVWYLCVK